GWGATVGAPSGPQHSGSLRAITARQLQALVRQHAHATPQAVLARPVDWRSRRYNPANPIQIWIPDAYARELVPVALIATPLEEVVNVLGDLVFRADDPSPPVSPGKQQEHECGNKKSAEHACWLTDRA